MCRPPWKKKEEVYHSEEILSCIEQHGGNLEKQLADTQKREKYKIYGELLTAYAYQIPAGVTHAEVLNYYDNQEISIPLDKDLTAMENASRYFETSARGAAAKQKRSIR